MRNTSTRDPAGTPEPPHRGAGAWWRERLGHPLRVAGFWTGVALPFVYLPLLLTGIGSATEAQLLAMLVMVQAVGLWVGRSYRRD